MALIQNFFVIKVLFISKKKFDGFSRRSCHKIFSKSLVFIAQKLYDCKIYDYTGGKEGKIREIEGKRGKQGKKKKIEKNREKGGKIRWTKRKKGEDENIGKKRE